MVFFWRAPIATFQLQCQISSVIALSRDIDARHILYKFELNRKAIS